ncbi:MAG: ATP-binding cassette domain-containing protein [Polyangiaceae bacterium]
MGALVFREVGFAYEGGVALLSEASFRLAPGVYGVVGENGAGKTTLLRLASGELAPDSGEVMVLPRGGRVVGCPQTAEVPGEDVESLLAATDGEALFLCARMGVERRGIERWGTRCRSGNGGGSRWRRRSGESRRSCLSMNRRITLIPRRGRR